MKEWLGVLGILTLGEGATSVSVKNKDSTTSSPHTTKRWFSPIVESQKGAWRTSASRMGRTQGDEYAQFAKDPYEGL